MIISQLEDYEISQNDDFNSSKQSLIGKLKIYLYQSNKTIVFNFSIEYPKRKVFDHSIDIKNIFDEYEEISSDLIMYINYLIEHIRPKLTIFRKKLTLG